MKNVLQQLFGFLFKSDEKWWLEIKTEAPTCTYYFGPFETESEAKAEQAGYVEDLQQEGSKVLVTNAIALTNPPQQLTIYEEAMDGRSPGPTPAFSGQS